MQEDVQNYNSQQYQQQQQNQFQYTNYNQQEQQAHRDFRPMPNEFESGAKIACLALGFFLGLIGTLIAYFIYKDRDQGGDGVKWSLIGIAIAFGVSILMVVAFMVFFGGIASLAAVS